jgi:hypothetical protein
LSSSSARTRDNATGCANVDKRISKVLMHNWMANRRHTSACTQNMIKAAVYEIANRFFSYLQSNTK